MGTDQTLKRRTVGVLALPAHVYLAYLAYLLVCTLLFTGVSFSRFAATQASGDTARVAAGVIATQAGTWDDTRKAYTFTVSNTQNNQTSQVALSYDVVVTLSQALPEGVDMQLNGTSGTANGNTYTFSHAGTLVAGTQSQNTHTLTFFGSATETSNITVTVSVMAQQIN